MPASKRTPDETEELFSNGYRAVREAKGYGRVAAAEALGITTGALWKIETAAEGKELAAAIKELKALPDNERPVREKKVAAAKPAKAPAAKAPAAKKAGVKAKAKPAAATDLI